MEERSDISHAHDYELPGEEVLHDILDGSEVKHPEKQPEVERRNQRDSDHGSAPEIKGEGGARGKSGGSSQPGNQENHHQNGSGKK